MDTRTRSGGQHDIVVDDYFGGCPTCGMTDGYLNVDRNHWFVCHAHKKRWCVGSNLFGGWRDETEDIWAANEELLNRYDVVQPLEVGRWPRDPKAQAKARARWDFEKAWKERNLRVGDDPRNRVVVTAKADLPLSSERH
jgi:hypothetical protein